LKATLTKDHDQGYIFIYYATKAAQENTNIQTYEKTREAIRNKTTMKLQICSYRSGKRVCHCTLIGWLQLFTAYSIN